MKVIVKNAGQPPMMVDTKSTHRMDVIREVLGKDVQPLFFSLSFIGSFNLCYDSRWFLNTAPINFFAFYPNIGNSPVTAIYGNAVFVRTKVVTKFDEVKDFEVIDCTESDLEYIKEHLLKVSHQRKYYKQYLKGITQDFIDKKKQSPNLVFSTESLSIWREGYFDATDGVLGYPIKKKLRIPNTEQEMRNTPINENSFVRHCKNLGLMCWFNQNMVFIQTVTSFWRIFFEGHYVTSVGHENYAHDTWDGEVTEGFHLQTGIEERNIYLVAEYIAAHDERRYQREHRGVF